jgi:hypothetical protein
MEQIATGVLLFIAGILAMFAVAIIFLTLGKYEAQDRLPTPAEPPIHRVVFVQGNWLLAPFRAEAVVCPVILGDGSLDPAYRYQTTGEVQIKHVPFFVPRTDLHRVPPPSEYVPDYRFHRRETMPYVQKDSWAFGQEIGFLQLDEHLHVEGSLTDEGWSTEPRVCDSLRKSLLPPLDTVAAFGFYSRYQAARGPVLLYATEEGLYRADFLGHKVECVAPLDRPKSAFIPRAMPPETWRCFVLTRDKVHWIEYGEKGRTGSFDRPKALSRLEESEVASGSDGRMIVRTPIPGTQVEEGPQYHVTVLSERGELMQDYDYRFPNGRSSPDLLLPGDPEPEWRKIVHTTSGGRACQAILPPVISATSAVATRGSTLWQYIGNQLDLDPRSLAVSLWMSLPIPGVLAVLVGKSARRRSRSWVIPAFWVVFTLLFGWVAALVYGMLAGREWKVACDGCRASVSPRFSRCPRCHAPATKPKMLGIEILHPIEGDSKS